MLLCLLKIKAWNLFRTLFADLGVISHMSHSLVIQSGSNKLPIAAYDHNLHNIRDP